MLSKIVVYIKRMRGNDRPAPRKPFFKIAWSWLGAFLGIYLIAKLNTLIGTDTADTFFLVGSFGASAVLLYGAPQLEFSQPRNLVGGHFLSALVGITVYRYLPFDLALMSALAVSIAIVVMHLTRTMHPPGGATALIAVIGGEQVHKLSYMLAFSPILVGALVMLMVALVINNLSKSPKRHYPRYWF